MVVKLSSEQIKQLGNIKDASEFSAAFNAMVEKANESKTEQKVVSVEDVTAIFAAQAGTLHADFKTLKASVDAVNPESLVAKAKEAGSTAAAQALGAVGASGAAADKGAANEGPDSNASASATLIASGDYEGAWKADKKLQEEFSNAKVYASYMKAETAGQVRIQGK